MCNVSVLNEEVGSSNLLELETLLRVRNDTRHSLFITVYALEQVQRAEAPTAARAGVFERSCSERERSSGASAARHLFNQAVLSADKLESV